MVFAGASVLLDILVVFNATTGRTVASSMSSRGDGSEIGIYMVNVQHTVAQTNVTELRLLTTTAGGFGAGSRFILARVKKP